MKIHRLPYPDLKDKEWDLLRSLVEPRLISKIKLLF